MTDKPSPKIGRIEPEDVTVSASSPEGAMKRAGERLEEQLRARVQEKTAGKDAETCWQSMLKNNVALHEVLEGLKAGKLSLDTVRRFDAVEGDVKTLLHHKEQTGKGLERAKFRDELHTIVRETLSQPAVRDALGRGGLTI